MNVNTQGTVIETQKYTKEGYTTFERVYYSMQHIDTTSHSTSSGASSLSIALIDMNVNTQGTVSETHDYTKE